MSSIFSKIVKGEIPCHKIMEDDCYLAFLDIRPINPGHTLVVPKQEIDYIFDLDENTLSGLMLFAQRVAVKIKKSVTCQRIGIMVAGLEVAHAHVHLVPINSVGDLNFEKETRLAPTFIGLLSNSIDSRYPKMSSELLGYVPSVTNLDQLSNVITDFAEKNVLISGVSPWNINSDQHPQLL